MAKSAQIPTTQLVSWMSFPLKSLASTSVSFTTSRAVSLSTVSLQRRQPTSCSRFARLLLAIAVFLTSSLTTAEQFVILIPSFVLTTPSSLISSRERSPTLSSLTPVTLCSSLVAVTWVVLVLSHIVRSTLVVSISCTSKTLWKGLLPPVSPTFSLLVKALSHGCRYQRARVSSLPSLRSGTLGESVLLSSKLVARCLSTFSTFIGAMSCMLMPPQKTTCNTWYFDYALTHPLPVVVTAWCDEDIRTSFSSLAFPSLNPLCHLPSRTLTIYIDCCCYLHPVERHGETCQFIE